MFVDQVRIVARAGNGGSGACSFLREKNRPDGGPDGGNGGQGGSVVILVDANVNNLIKYRYSPHQFAKNGQNGGTYHKTGKSGLDCTIIVPPGPLLAAFRRPSFPSVRTNTAKAAACRKTSPPCPRTRRSWSPWPT